MHELTQGAPAATAILAAMVIASLFALYRAPAWLDRHLLRPYWLLPRRQYASVVTSGFLHADLPHLLFNGFTFFAFGPSLERALGTPRFVALYGVGLLASAAGTWLVHRRDPGYASVGASGAILAVLFASIVVTPTQSIFILPLPVPIPAPLSRSATWPTRSSRRASRRADASTTTRICRARWPAWPSWR